MSITKDSKEWLAALALVPERRKSKHVVMVNDQPEWCRLHGESGIHANSTPDITPDLLYTILEVMVTKYRTMQAIDWEMNFEGRSFRDAIIRAAASLQEAK